MNWTKSKLLKEIKEMEMGIKMEEDILKTIEDCKHYSHVNKRFCDKLKDLGYHCYIQKDTWSTILSCTATQSQPEKDFYSRYHCEFRYYATKAFSNVPLTWEGIKQCLISYNYSQRLLDAKERLLLIDDEINKTRDLLNNLQSIKFKCFYFYKGIHEIQDALREATQ